MKLRTKLAAAALVGCALVGGAAAPSVAAPDDVTIQGCQPANVALRYIYRTSDGGTAVVTKTCSGLHSFNSRGVKLEAGRWSGFVFFAAGDPEYFCDAGEYTLGDRRIIGIVMNPTRMSFCNGAQEGGGRVAALR